MKDKVAEVSHLFLTKFFCRRIEQQLITELLCYYQCLIKFFYGSVPPNIATLPSILQCSCAINCSDQVAPELASCKYINFNKIVDFNTFLADFC